MKKVIIEKGSLQAFLDFFKDNGAQNAVVEKPQVVGTPPPQNPLPKPKKTTSSVGVGGMDDSLAGGVHTTRK